MSRVIVVSAHPDDEVLGAGGTLLRHAAAGDELYWLIATGLLAESGVPLERVDERQSEIAQVAGMFGFRQTIQLDHPTTTLSSQTLVELVPQISDAFTRIAPEIVYCVNRTDVHSDHRVVADAVAACTKSYRHPSVRTVLMYECLSETEFAPALPERTFLPNYFVDVSEHFERKLEILQVYASELGEHPFPRSLENVRALATLRGATAGVRYAEAFQLVRHREV